MKYRDMRQAKIMFNAKRPWPEILNHFDNRFTQEQILIAFENERRRNRKRNNQSAGKFWTGIIELADRQVVPEKVLADRDYRRWRDHPELTGRICGDPLPEYSALARRQSA